ncbi:hypothetical protein GCM10023321_32070 [Pseudonocardia eucalypti]|uniref:Spheroidene monooxygenase n=1 Tax=Pseudonocardia eucalypti TaxID=648755 RepID=A0ABP9Q913_9PSEU|nr:hypothetical protein [Pseudonocardia eucalypti]
MAPARAGDFLTIDAVARPAGGVLRWRRAVRAALAGGPGGLRAATVNHTNNGTHSIVPRVIPGGCALVAAWDSPEAAAAAWRGPLCTALEGRGRFSLDGEVARVRLREQSHRWHGWAPSATGAQPLAADEPLVVVVHGVLRPRHLAGFLRNNMHAASRAAHHPGHRGSVDISSKLPFEHTSISLWKTVAMAQDYAYAPGGHAYAMKHALTADTHHTGVFLRVRPLASTGSLGIDTPAFPDLPPADRGRLTTETTHGVNR